MPRDWRPVLVLVLFVVVAPWWRRRLYRGVLLSRLRRSFAPWPAVVISARVFAASTSCSTPAAIYAVPGLFVVGVVSGWLRFAPATSACPLSSTPESTSPRSSLLTFAEDLAGPAAGW